MKKILILNFTRIGDLIQTSPLLSGLKEEFPGCRITLAANVSFSGICKNLPHIDKLTVFDPKQFIHADGGQTSIADVYFYLDNFVAQLAAEKFDMLINLSHSNLTAIMGRLLNIPDVRGIVSDGEGNKVINDPWLMYFSSLLSFRRYNTFNLVDIYQLSGGVKPKGRGLFINSAEPERLAAPLLAECGVKEGERLIGIQAGASMKERRWPSRNFAKSADLLARRWNAKAVLLGAAAEKELVDETAAAMEMPHINLAGKTSLEQLIGVVKRCAVLVTNDTATMHIAAAAGTPIVALFLVHAYGFETGPYCDKAVLLEPEMPCFPCLHSSTCPHYACLDYVTPEMVADAAQHLADNPGGMPPLGPAAFPKVRLLAPYFDQYGFWDLRPLKKSQSADTDILARIYRQFFMQPFGVGSGKEFVAGYLAAHYAPPDAEELRRWVERKRGVFRKLADAAGEGETLAREAVRDLKNGRMDKVKKTVQRFLDVDRAIDMAGLAHPELMPAVRLFNMGKGNIGNAAPVVMLEETRALYAAAAGFAVFVMDRLEELLK
ncbi:MAG: glycosyltransferase family 9 protein [Nitrospinae bacterium]|nr:glycosyltransferase family 9 protein [Nitrospinota bacterium]